MNLRLSALAATLCATALPAQMSGSFLIDPNGPSGVFHSFTEAVNALFVAASTARVSSSSPPAPTPSR